jgi:hypothetical protein
MLATTTSTPPHHQESCGQPRKEHTTSASPRPRAPESRGHLPHPRLGPFCVQTRVAPAWGLALGNVTCSNQCKIGPQRTLLSVVVSICPSSSSTAVDIDATREDGQLALSNSKSQTYVAEVRRASSSASTSLCAGSSTPSCPAASSRQSVTSSPTTSVVGATPPTQGAGCRSS